MSDTHLPPPPVWPEPVDPAQDDRGFVFAASGRKYTRLAIAAARTVRATHPGIAIDLYTDADADDPVFDQVHQLEKSWFRPKFEALQRCRFGRAIYLDCDLAVIGDLSDVFWTLQRFDLAAAHVQNRNMPFAVRIWRAPMPNAFPQINTGVLGVRLTDRTRAFLRQVHDALAATKAPLDQIVVRELLWDSDLRLCVLPEEYNWRKHESLYLKNWTVPAPRVLHSQRFVRRMVGDRPPTLRAVYGRLLLALVRLQMRGDRQLTRPEDRPRWVRRFLK